MCRCRKSAGKAAPAELQESGVVFGEQGLVKLRCSENCETVYGDYTGMVYRFDYSPTVYVDKRDVVFLLRPGIDYA